VSHVPEDHHDVLANEGLLGPAEKLTLERLNERVNDSEGSGSPVLLFVILQGLNRLSPGIIIAVIQRLDVLTKVI